MQITPEMLHDAYLQAQREVYKTPEAQQRPYEALNENEWAAYDRMAELLNEKGREDKGTAYKCRKCDYSFTVKPGQLIPAIVPTHCGMIMETARL